MALALDSRIAMPRRFISFFRLSLVSLALVTALHAAGADDHGLIRSTVLPGAFTPKDGVLKVEADFKNQSIDSPISLTLDESGRISTSSLPSLPAANDPVSAEPVGHHSITSRSPWLYIIIGFLIVTGVFLYVDPKMF